MKKVYFSGSISGGRKDIDIYRKIIEYIDKKGIVLTEHIGNKNYSISNRTKCDDINIYNNDINLLNECDLVIGECSNPSLGVGYEMCYAEKIGKPVYIFYRKEIYLSAMLNGNNYFNIYSYSNINEVYKKIDEILGE